MTGMYFDPESLTGADKTSWEKWSTRAEDATASAINAFENWLKQPTPAFQHKFDDTIWKELKEWYRTRVFYQKCAYCESKFSRYRGDAEHYRPKSSVKLKNSEPRPKYIYPTCDLPVLKDVGLRTIKHPGYFWLAYHWRNLIPACTQCNSGLGKNDRFEIDGNFTVLQQLTPEALASISDAEKPRESKTWPGHFYPSPQMLDKIEAPFLLNPLNPKTDRDPRKHLRFGVRGIVTAIDDSRSGELSISMLQLDEPDLQDARQLAQEDFQDEYFDLLRKVRPDAWRQKITPLLDMYERGTKPFSAAALDFHEQIKVTYR